MKPDMDSPASAVHRLLFQALLEIREQGHEGRNKVVFHLADLFHNVVLDMEAAARGERPYESVLASLNHAAAERGLSRWLDKSTADLTALQEQMSATDTLVRDGEAAIPGAA